MKKKQLKHCVLFVLVFAIAYTFCLSLVSAEGSAVKSGTDQGYSYAVLEDNSACITKYSNGGDVVIPESLGGHSVTAIGERAFDRNQEVTSVTIPEGVISIDANAFYWCGNMTAVTLPDSLQQIGPEAFGMCNALKTINLSKKHQYFELKNGVLFNKPEKTLIFYPLTKKIPIIQFRTEHFTSHSRLSALMNIFNLSRFRNPFLRSERMPSIAVSA